MDLEARKRLIERLLTEPKTNDPRVEKIRELYKRRIDREMEETERKEKRTSILQRLPDQMAIPHDNLGEQDLQDRDCASYNTESDTRLRLIYAGDTFEYLFCRMSGDQSVLARTRNGLPHFEVQISH